MKQASRIQRQMEEIQAQLAQRKVEATSGGGVVKVVATCNGVLDAIHIDPQAVNPADVELLQELVLTATNNALNQAREIANTEMGKATGGVSIPGLM